MASDGLLLNDRSRFVHLVLSSSNVSVHGGTTMAYTRLTRAYKATCVASTSAMRAFNYSWRIGNHELDRDPGRIMTKDKHGPEHSSEERVSYTKPSTT